MAFGSPLLQVRTGTDRKPNIFTDYCSLNLHRKSRVTSKLCTDILLNQQDRRQPPPSLVKPLVSLLRSRREWTSRSGFMNKSVEQTFTVPFSFENLVPILYSNTPTQCIKCSFLQSDMFFSERIAGDGKYRPSSQHTHTHTHTRRKAL